MAANLYEGEALACVKNKKWDKAHYIYLTESQEAHVTGPWRTREIVI